MLDRKINLNNTCNFQLVKGIESFYFSLGMMDRRLGASGARKTACRSPRELYVTSIQFNNNQNKCSISHKTPHCQPNVMISSAVLALLFACRRPNAPPLPKAATRPVSTGQSADRQESGVEEKMASDVFK